MSRYLRLAVILSQCLMLLGLPEAAQAADANAQNISAGLQSFADSLDGLDNLDELGDVLPFTALQPTSADGLRLADVFVQSLRNQLAGQVFNSIAELDNFLDAGMDGTYSGVTVDANGQINGNLLGTVYDVTLAVTATRALTTPLAFAGDALILEGGALNTDLRLTFTLPFRFETPDTLYLVASPSLPSIAVGLDAEADFNAVPFPASVGLLGVNVNGAADTSLRLLAQLQDRDNDGRITRDEWESLAPVDLFDLGFDPASRVTLALRLTTDLSGLDSAAATITLDDTNLGNDLDAPVVNLGAFSDFKNVTPLDFVAGLAQTAVILRAVQTRLGSFQLPFMRDRMDEKVALNTRLLKFFTDNGLSNVADPLSIVITDTQQLEGLDTVQEVADKLSAALDVPGVTMNYDTGARRLAWNMAISETLTPITGTLDFADQLESVGITGLHGPDDAEVLVDVAPAYSFDFGIGVDFAPSPDPANPLSVLERFALDTAGPEFTASAPVKGDFALEGRIGFLGIGLADNNSDPLSDLGRVTLVGPRPTDAGAMLRVDLDGGADNALTFTEMFAALQAGSVSAAGAPGVFELTAGGDTFATATVNVGVPSLGVVASASLGSTPAVTGTLTVDWPDITQGAPSLTPSADFNSQLLAFDFNHANPQELLSLILEVVDTFATQLDALSRDNSDLDGDLPLAGVSFRDMLNQPRVLKARITELTSNPAATLQDLEDQLNASLAEAYEGTLANPDFVDISLDTAGGPAAVVFKLGIGACSTNDTNCNIVKPLNVPFNLEFGEGQGGLTEVLSGDAQGSAALDYRAIARLDFGVQLPAVSQGSTTPQAETTCADAADDDGDGFVNDGCPANGASEGATQVTLGECSEDLDNDSDGFVNDGCPARANPAPGASGSPSLFILDTSGITLSVTLSAATQLSAALGPLNVAVGKLAATGESSAQCSNAADDDQDGFVNDGCPTEGDAPEGGTPETLAECGNSLDDDTDGVVNDGCPAKNNPVIARVGASFNLANDFGAPGPTRIGLASGDLGAYIGSLAPASFRPTPQLTCPGLSGNFDGCARLPVFFEDELLGVITFTADDITDSSTWTPYVPPEILDNLANAALDWGLIVEGMRYVNNTLAATLDSASYGTSVPIVGDSLEAGADILTKFDYHVLQPLNDLADTVEGFDEPSEVSGEIKTFFVDALQTDDGTLLLDISGDSTVGPDDVRVVLKCTGNVDCDDDDHNTTDIIDAQVQFALGQTALETEFPFEFGFPGLRLAADGDAKVKASVEWRIDLAFGLSRAEGFYLVTNNPVQGDATKPEIVVQARADLPDNGDPDSADLRGDIAFIRLNIEDTHDGPSQPDLNLRLGVNVTGGGSDARIPFTELVGGADPLDFDVRLGGGVTLNLAIETTGEIPGVAAEGSLPTLKADFVLDWQWGAGENLSGLDSGDLTVEFNNVRIDLGSFVNEFLGPVVREVQRFTKPLQPVIDTISAPIPGISELAALVGEPPVTMLDLFEAASDSDLTLVRRVIELVSFINAIDAADPQIEISLGRFALDPGRLRGGPLTSDQADKLIATASLTTTNVLGSFQGDFKSKLEASRTGGGFSFPAFQEPTQLFQLLVGKDVTLIRWDAGTLSAGFGFSQTFGPIFIGPVPVSLVVSGSARIEGRFAVGYDTKGIRLAVKILTTATDTDPAEQIAFETVGALFAGVFIDDLDTNGNDVPEIRLTAELAAGAALDVVIASAGVEGGVRATIDLNLHDGGLRNPPRPEDLDGKLRIDEIVSFARNPLCMFDVSGKLEAFIRVFVKIGIGPFSKKFSKTIVNVTLLDLQNLTEDLCKAEPPEVATQIGDVLRLNIGPHADERNCGADCESKEKVTVRQLSARDGAGRAQVSVTGFGRVMEFSGIKTIFGDGGSDDDVILLEAGTLNTNGPGGAIQTQIFTFTLSAILCGGLGDDTLSAGFGADTLVGDGAQIADTFTCSTVELHSGGDDKLKGGGNTDVLYGMGGDDEINGDEGADTLNGGSGADVVNGGYGPDIIRGGLDADDLQGGPEPEPKPRAGVLNPDPNDPADWKTYPVVNPNTGLIEQIGIRPVDVLDTIYGDGGDDSISGEFGDDRLYGGPDQDTLTGDRGNDQMFGDGGDDRLLGSEGNDEIHGGDGHDDLFGESGDDALYGDAGFDNLIGGLDTSVTCNGFGGDLLRGGPGRDYLLGDEGVIDRAPGDWNAVVTLEGEHPGNDRLYGDEGDDVLYGQSGCDAMYGDTHTASGGDGDDWLNGGDGDDLMYGDGADDEMYGESGNDTLYGDDNVTATPDGDDYMRGGTGDDILHGNGGLDEIFGDSGLDSVFGDDDDDIIRGSPEDDNLFGGPGDDIIFGDAGNDHIEGNGGADMLFGEAGHDLLIGGGSSAGADDVGDTLLSGGPGDDVIAGDNALIAFGGLDTVGVPTHTITLFDLSTVGVVAPATAFGGDTVNGDSGDDTLFGQGGADQISGGDGEDYVEGNDGNDTINGNDGDDDLIGGGSANDGVIDADRVGDGLRDVGETLVSGGPGDDLIAGDNARILRTPARLITLFDVPFAGVIISPLAHGGDLLRGEEGRDRMYGQGGEDWMFGGDGGDYLEGNAQTDRLYGEAGDDDLVGGSGQDHGGANGALRELRNVQDDGDYVYGGEQADVMLGDNGFISRPGGLNSFNGSVRRSITLYDVQVVTGPDISPQVSGADFLFGGESDDVMFGQAKNDLLHGDAGADYMEGNHDDDLMYGDGGEDDLTGGGSANDGVIDADRLGDGLRDGSDGMYGDDGNLETSEDDGDVLAGDNALITRPLNASGLWMIDPNTGDVLRNVMLFDVQVVGGPAIDPATSGGDQMYGEGGRDFLFGQGNGAQPPNAGDPLDAIDNDRDGRESAASVVYDCLDGRDNDDDGQADGADPGCAALVDEDSPWLGDELHGGNGDDYLEGNHGADWMFGEGGEDDLLGGSSSGNGVIGGPLAVDLRDGNDVLNGGEEDDALVGDNGDINRLTDAAGLWLRLVGGLGPFNLVRRDVSMAQTPERAGAYGNDFLRGQEGDDDLYGQLGEDYAEGNAGEDALVGDLGRIANNLLGDGVDDPELDQVIRPNPPFLSDTIFVAGTLYRQVQLYAFQTGGGADTLLGGDGNDSLHGGAGGDLINGNAGEDRAFGGDGSDALWGGPDHDHLWGGHGDDFLDVQPRSAPYDSPLWFTYARFDNYQDIDYLYGGWDQDALQADVADTGPVVGDRLLDWVGAYNVYYLCPALYGDWVITRGHSPSIIRFLQDLAQGDGALDTGSEGASGFREVGMVFPNQAGDNSHPPHPDNPGHFTCDSTEGGTPTSTPTWTPTPTPTGTLLPSATPTFVTATPQPTRTRHVPPSKTPMTPEASRTPHQTNTPKPSRTPEPSRTPSATPLHTPTPTATLPTLTQCDVPANAHWALRAMGQSANGYRVRGDMSDSSINGVCSKLRAIQRKLERRQFRAASNQLRALIRFLELRRGVDITEVAATDLIGQAEAFDRTLMNGWPYVLHLPLVQR